MDDGWSRWDAGGDDEDARGLVLEGGSVRESADATEALPSATVELIARTRERSSVSMGSWSVRFREGNVKQ